jgi:hypothetical protein
MPLVKPCHLLGLIVSTLCSCLQEVTSVRKKTHLRFPNSIKLERVDASPSSLEVNGGAPQLKTYFFTSFLSRDEAFKLISTCWRQTRHVDTRVQILELSGVLDLVDHLSAHQS